MLNKLAELGILLIIFTLINCQGAKDKSSNSISDLDVKEKSDSIQVAFPQSQELPPILDSIKNQLPQISLSEIFNVNKESDDNIDEEFLKLSSVHIEYFYSSEELKQYYDYFNFSSYYYGYDYYSNGLTKVFIINTNWNTAIYLDCFILNSKEEILDNFHPFFIELQPSYSFSGFGRFQNDSVYNLTAIDYETLDFVNYKAIKDSTTIKYTIGNNGKISESIEKHGVDTIYHFHKLL